METDLGRAAPPPFCARCRRIGGDGPLCGQCGDALRPAGYCTVCEGRVLAEPGHLCPKHEVELVDGPRRPEVDPSAGRLVTVATFGLPSEAQGPRLRLEAEGIPAVLQGHRMGDIYQVATGGALLQVPESFADDARVLLAQTWSPPKEIDEDPDDPWEGLGPDPAERRRAVMKGLILVGMYASALVYVVGVLLGWLGRR